MRTAELLGSYAILLFAEGPDAVVAELRHVAPMGNGGRVETPVGHLAAARAPAEPEAAAHWRVDLNLRTDVAANLLNPRLAEAMADWLLAETACTKPLLLNVHMGRNTSFVQRGEIWDDE
jgi:hypothetical protein